MSNSITGNTPAPMLNNEQSSSNPLFLITPDGIRQKDGLYSLNDIHKMAGGHKRQSPYYYLKSPQGKEIIAIYESKQNYEPLNSGSYICSVKGKGRNQGTYADFAIALDYASWIDKRFFILLSQYVKNGITPQAGELAELHTLTSKFNYLNNLDTKASTLVSNAGYILVVGGKQLKPLIKLAEKALLNQIQLSLPFTGE